MSQTPPDAPFQCIAANTGLAAVRLCLVIPTTQMSSPTRLGRKTHFGSDLIFQPCPFQTPARPLLVKAQRLDDELALSAMMERG